MRATLLPALDSDLRQWTAFIVNEHLQHTKEVWIEWDQTGMVGHQYRAGLFVEGDVGWVGPGHWIR